MKITVRYFCALLTAIAGFLILSCGGDSGSSNSDIVSYAGSIPEGDYIVIQIDRENSKVRRINYTADPDDDSGWLDYTALEPSDDDANGFTLLNRVEIDSDSYVLFMEMPDTAVIYQEFSSSGDAEGLPAFVVMREKVDKTEYYEKTYNWMKFNIDADQTVDSSSMNPGFIAFDSSAGSGLMYGAGYSNTTGSDETFKDINENNITIDDFTESEEFVANLIWAGTEGDMDDAVILAGSASGANVIDFGPGDNAGGGMGLMIPQSDVTLAEAAGTYLFLCYENNKTDETASINPVKVVISGSSPNIKLFNFSDNTGTATAQYNHNLSALYGSDSPDGTDMADEFNTVTGISNDASSSAIKNSYKCEGAFVAVDTSPDCFVYLIFDPDGEFCGFTMFETDSSGDFYIRFGFGIKDAGYTNQYL